MICSLCKTMGSKPVANSNVCYDCHVYLKKKYGEEFKGIW